MCLILGYVPPSILCTGKENSCESLKFGWTWSPSLNLEPEPGIQTVVSVKIKIATVEYSYSNSNPHRPPPPQKKNVQGICSQKQNPAETGFVRKKTLQAENVPASYHFSNGPSLNLVFWFSNRPFYSCRLSNLASEWQRGWSWPCFDTDLAAFIM